MNPDIAMSTWDRLKVDCEGNAMMCRLQEQKSLGNILASHLEEIWNGDLAGQKFPSSWEIELPNTHCNIGGDNPSKDEPACLMCPRHLKYNPQADHIMRVCDKLSPYREHIHAIHILGVAEPFYKDLIFDVLDRLCVEDCKHKICISTTTNGTILHEPRRRRWLRYPTSVLTFSIDAATPETYELIRRVPMYHRVVDNLLAYARERTHPWQSLRIHNNINLLNIKEVDGMVELASAADAPIEFNPSYTVPLIEVNPTNVHMFQEAEDIILAAGERLKTAVSFMRKMTLDIDPGLEPKTQSVLMSMVTGVAEELAVPAGTLIKAMPETIEVLVPVL